MTALLLQSAPPAGLADLAASAFPIVVLLFISWLLLFRPMMKEKREKQEMREALKPGDRILTIGGIYGTVTRMADERAIFVRVAQGVELEMARTAVATVVPTEGKE
jgi:preprotein translocase subunit YajC